MRAGGAECVEEPGGEAGAVGRSGGIDGRRQGIVVGWWRAWGGEWRVAPAVEEGSGWVGGDLPALRRNFDDFAFGVGEIEEDGGGAVWIATGGEAAGDRESGGARIGAGFKSADGLAEGVGSGRLVVFGVEGVD